MLRCSSGLTLVLVQLSLGHLVAEVSQVCLICCGRFQHFGMSVGFDSLRNLSVGRFARPFLHFLFSHLFCHLFYVDFCLVSHCFRNLAKFVMMFGNLHLGRCQGCRLAVFPSICDHLGMELHLKFLRCCVDFCLRRILRRLHRLGMSYYLHSRLQLLKQSAVHLCDAFLRRSLCSCCCMFLFLVVVCGHLAFGCILSLFPCGLQGVSLCLHFSCCLEMSVCLINLCFFLVLRLMKFHEELLSLRLDFLGIRLMCRLLLLHFNCLLLQRLHLWRDFARLGRINRDITNKEASRESASSNHRNNAYEFA